MRRARRTDAAVPRLEPPCRIARRGLARLVVVASSAWVTVASAQSGVADGRTGDVDPPAADARHDAMIEVALNEQFLAPGAYDVEVSGDSLDAGLGIGTALELRILALRGWTFDLGVLTLRRASDDPRLSPSRLSEAAFAIFHRFMLATAWELRVGMRAGYDGVDFDDAEVWTTGLGLALQGTFQAKLVGSVWLECALGVRSQPLGGHAASDVRFGPTPYGLLGFAWRDR